VWRAIICDEINAGDLGFFTAVFCVRRNGERRERSLKCVAVTFENHSGATPISPSLGRPPAMPNSNMRMLSVIGLAEAVAFCSCIACLSFALPRWVKPVPETRTRSGAPGTSIGRSNRQPLLPV